MPMMPPAEITPDAAVAIEEIYLNQDRFRSKKKGAEILRTFPVLFVVLLIIAIYTVYVAVRSTSNIAAPPSFWYLSHRFGKHFVSVILGHFFFVQFHLIPLLQLDVDLDIRDSRMYER